MVRVHLDENGIDGDVKHDTGLQITNWTSYFIPVHAHVINFDF